MEQQNEPLTSLELACAGLRLVPGAFGGTCGAFETGCRAFQSTSRAFGSNVTYWCKELMNLDSVWMSAVSGLGAKVALLRLANNPKEARIL